MSLIDHFQSRAVVRGGIPLFLAFDALDVIAAAATQNIRILGIDGFFLTDQTTQPSMADSVDYSRERVSVVDKASAFIRERAVRGLYFEIVLAE